MDASAFGKQETFEALLEELHGHWRKCHGPTCVHCLDSRKALDALAIHFAGPYMHEILHEAIHMRTMSRPLITFEQGNPIISDHLTWSEMKSVLQYVFLRTGGKETPVTRRLCW